MGQILIVEGWHGEPLPGPPIRFDLAWPLFLPDSPGDVPAAPGQQLLPLARWFWDTMGRFGGRMAPAEAGPICCVVPRLSEAALELVIRLASFCCRRSRPTGRPRHLAAGRPDCGPRHRSA